MKKQDLIKLATLAALIIIAYIPTFIWMYDRWNAKDSYYNHGFLVPFISIFLIWQMRDKLKSIKINPSNMGWLFLGAGLLIHLISAVWRVYFSSGFSLILTIIGIALLFFGKDYLKKLFFPISFLIFMIPLPLVAIANLSFQLKIFAAKISTFIINNLGIRAIREGSIIKTANSYLIVEDPCSGIRSLIALIALGALMGYLSNLSRSKRMILFASSIPIAISTNVIRIVSLSLVSEIYGAKWATGMFHTAMGLFVFVFAFIGLLIVENTLK
ncbi:MAG: exosortase/archaeosortase family protein [Candidatus Omnitrophica bacterium]|nr:exosortase/archaeosortase family protein [Candidatus Omnitrophota bacterium]